MYKRQLQGRNGPLFCAAIRPVAEYAVPAFHSMMPDHLSRQLERQQTQALKHIYGQGFSASAMRGMAGVEPLHVRREKSTLKFAEKAAKNPRFARWFPRREATSTRVQRPYVQKISRAQRHFNSPVNYMVRILNNKAAK